MDVTVLNDVIQCGNVARNARIIAIDEKCGKLAVIRKRREKRQHDYVEFYNILTGWLSVPEIVVCPENGSIEHAMFVVGGELLTCHANGSICFIDPHDSRRVKRVQVAASTIWASCSMTAKENEDITKVALISHSSILYVFDVVNKLIVSSISLGVDSRLFDVSSNGELIAIGSIDGIMICGDGQVKRTLKLDRENRRDPTIAWSVVFWKSNVLACGDSRGSVTLWNPVTGALIQSLNCMQSHVLTMCVLKEELVVAGIDPRITSIKQMTTGEYEVIRRRNGPVRDVRCLATYDGRVYASGEDFEIYVGKNGCRGLVNQLKRNVRVGGEITASCGENFLDIWWKKTGENEEVETDEGIIIPQLYRPVFLVKLFSPKQNVITCWNISKNGMFVAIGTNYNTSVYSIRPETKKKIVKLAVFDVAATAIHLNEDTKELIVCCDDFKIVRYSWEKPSRKPVTISEQAQCGSITSISVSGCSKYAAVITSRSQVFIVNMLDRETRLVKVTLPIDIICNSDNAFVLTSEEAFSENCDHQKILHEVKLSTGKVNRSLNANSLKMLPTSPNSYMPGLPVAMNRIDDHRFIVYSYDGHWSLINTNSGEVFSVDGSQKKAKKISMDEGLKLKVVDVMMLRNEDDGMIEETPRIIELDVEGDIQPSVNAFKLKKFGMQ